MARAPQLTFCIFEVAEHRPAAGQKITHVDVTIGDRFDRGAKSFNTYGLLFLPGHVSGIAMFVVELSLAARSAAMMRSVMSVMSRPAAPSQRRHGGGTARLQSRREANRPAWLSSLDSSSQPVCKCHKLLPELDQWNVKRLRRAVLLRRLSTSAAPLRRDLE